MTTSYDTFLESWHSLVDAMWQIRFRTELRGGKYVRWPWM